MLLLQVQHASTGCTGPYLHSGKLAFTCASAHCKASRLVQPTTLVPSKQACVPVSASPVQKRVLPRRPSGSGQNTEDSFVLNGIALLSRLPCYFSQTDSHVAVLYIEVNAYDIAQVAAITHSDAQYHLCITQYDPCGSSERKRGHFKHADD